MGEFSDFGRQGTPTKGVGKAPQRGSIAGFAKGLAKPLVEEWLALNPSARFLERPFERLLGTNIESQSEAIQRSLKTKGTRAKVGGLLTVPGVRLAPGAFTASQATKGKLGEHPIFEILDVLPVAGKLAMPARIAGKVALPATLVDRAPIIKRLLTALESAKPIRAQQEVLFSAERGKRIALSAKAGAETAGEAGFFARKAPLAGELPKAKFETLELPQGDIDELFDLISKNPRLTNWQVVQAQTGLHKLVRGGTVPQQAQLELLSRVFGSDVVTQIAAKGNTRPITGAATALAGLTRGLMTTLDYSAPLRQGLAASTRHPVLAAKAFIPMVRSSLSKGAYKTVVDNIASRPTFDAMQRGRVALSALSDYGLNREEAFAAAQLAERIPGIGRLVSASNRAYSAFLTRLRADVFDSIIKGAPKPLAKMTNEELRAVGSWVNTVTGRGELGKLAPAANLLTTTIFAPRLIASRLSLINPRFYLQAARNPILRKEALTQAAALYGSIATVLGGAKAAGAKVETDWRSSDFGKISIPAKKGAAAATIRIIPAIFGVGTQTFGAPEGPRTRFEITGGLQPYIRLIGQLYTGEAISPTTGEPRTVRGRPVSRGELLQQFIEAKYSPVASAVRDILYKDLRPEDYNVIDQIVSRMTPMILQDWYELTQGGEETLGEAVDRRLRGQGTDTSGTGEFSNF